MKKILILFLTLFVGFANAQDLFQKNLYSADRVMELRKELELTDAQATKIKKIHSENAGKFSTMKWDLDDATEKLKFLLDESKINETIVQKQMDQVLALENSLKKQQLSTMVSIKNELSPEQQEILQSHRFHTVSDVKVVGYGANSVSSAKVLQGYARNYKIGTSNNIGLQNVAIATSPKVSVQVAGTSASAQPLYYLDTKDGMKQLKDFSSIDPDNIESINVLKDKAAVNAFGENAKNGVIVIKLKDGTKK
ncbi:Spy/CpxP family protein refolding chaperone [Algoriphagus aquimarinus]|uniref:Uncharacterized protein n=1 Tax=Algoriphagus aquimarinus TaxID=237018 RepID=A0A5C7B3G8_9BACT|nr:Spy/CpxP family protein refolding chaperone [Algoriphagus aquimarinus]TXE14289.1 hypothetical protein ESV85_01630 [Algoriphagus aquimarinus]